MIKGFEMTDYSCEVSIPDDGAYPLLVGIKGSIIRELEEKSGCRIEFNRVKRVAVLRGP